MSKSNTTCIHAAAGIYVVMFIFGFWPLIYIGGNIGNYLSYSSPNTVPPEILAEAYVILVYFCMPFIMVIVSLIAWVARARRVAAKCDISVYQALEYGDKDVMAVTDASDMMNKSGETREMMNVNEQSPLNIELTALSRIVVKK